jgi:hypothetical protein
VTYCDGSTLPYLGMQHPLRIFDVKDSSHESFSFNRGKFIVKSKSKEPNMIRALYEKWLGNRAAILPNII